MLVFVDESGQSHPNDSTINPVLCGICINESDIRDISRSIYRLKMKLFGKDTEVKSTSLIRRRIFTKNMTINKQYVDAFIKNACSFDIKVFAVVMEKPEKPVIISESYLPKHYKLLLKRVEYFCENTSHAKAILIFDEDPGNDLIVAKCITKFLCKSKIGKLFNHILEMPLFVSSKVTPAIQIADIFASVIRHYYENSLDIRNTNEIVDPFESWINDLFLQIEQKTEDIKVSSTGFTEYGFFKMGKTF